MARKKKGINKQLEFVENILSRTLQYNGSGTITTSSSNTGVVFYDPHTFAPMLRGADGILRTITYDRDLAMTGSTGIYIGGNYEIPRIDVYTIKAYRKSDFSNLIMLLTLWIDDESVKEKVRVCSEKFTTEKTEDYIKSLVDNPYTIHQQDVEPTIYSEEDFDKFILILTLEIDDIDIRNKFEETHQYWKKSVKR